MKLQPYIVFRAFFWGFLVLGSACFWLELFLFHHGIWFVFSGVCLSLACVAYYLMCESKRHPI